MTGFLTAGIVTTAFEVGLIYALVALSLFISFTILNICDLSTDGCYTFGCAVGAVVTIAGHPILAIFAAMLAGILSGAVTAVLQTKFGVQSILAGIIVNTALYTVNLAVMGFSSNLSIFGTDTVFSLVKGISENAAWRQWSSLIFLTVLVLGICLTIGYWIATQMVASACGYSPLLGGGIHIGGIGIYFPYMYLIWSNDSALMAAFPDIINSGAKWPWICGFPGLIGLVYYARSQQKLSSHGTAAFATAKDMDKSILGPWVDPSDHKKGKKSNR